MSDAILLQQRGRPAVCVGTEPLVRTVGMGMARALGYPDHKIVIIPNALMPGGRYFPREVAIKWAEAVVPDVVKVLTRG